MATILPKAAKQPTQNPLQKANYKRQRSTEVVCQGVETRQKMSARAKQLSTVEFCALRAHHATQQHLDSKLARFKDCKIDKENLDSYIHKKGKRIIVRAGEQTTSFCSNTQEESIQRAKEFLISLCDATLSNCGKPVKPE
jgi:hypothetical protein